MPSKRQKKYFFVLTRCPNCVKLYPASGTGVRLLQTSMKEIKNKEKGRMRNGILSLFKYWKNITKPTYYNVVSLPGESFEFETEALKLEKENEYMTLHMYEKLEKVYSKQESVVEKDDLLSQEGVFYKNESLPPVSAFANAPTFAWADLCGNPTPKNVELFSNLMAKKSVLVITFADRFRRPDGIDRDVLAFGAVSYMKHKLAGMTFLFSEEYKCKAQGMPMVMMAFTNSKSLASILNGKSTIRRPKKTNTKKLTSSVFKEVKALIGKGLSNELIMSKLKLRKMELAGYKAARTRELRGGWSKIKKSQ